MTSAEKASSQPDDNHDVVGWDAAPQGKDVPWHELPEPAPKRPLRRWFVRGGIVAAVTLVLLTVALPNLLPARSRMPVCGPAAPQNMKAIATAQAQFLKKKDFYAASGHDLNANGTLIAADHCAAFESWQNNGDSATPAPKAGNLYRMLQGESVNGPTGYYNVHGNTSRGLNGWGATARAVEPYTTGENQYLITGDGKVYQHPEPRVGDPMFKKFLLDSVPSAFNREGWLDPDKLAALGWILVK